jgi:hypothetical protein
VTFRTAAVTALGILIPVLAWAAPAAAGATSAVPASQGEPVNAVILADESGSMLKFPNEITGEQQAAIGIIRAAWWQDSRIAVLGFGSTPPVRGVSSSLAVDKLCGLTELNSPADLASLTRCAGEIAPRPAPKNNTDLAAALKVAQSVLSAPDPLHRLPLVFILTDGMLDVGADSPYAAFPSTDAQGNAAAQQLITGTILPSLKSAGIEVWPVGFGQADQGELSQFASGAAQVNPYCPNDPDAAPKLTAVSPGVTGAAETQAIQQALLGAFAATSCGTINRGTWITLPPGGSKNVPVTIDPLTTLGSIVVNKGNPQVAVTYTDPNGGHVSDNSPDPQSTGFLNGAPYALTTGGTQSSQEALRLDDPVPGQWNVTFTNPTAVPEIVGVSVVWQGQAYPDIEFSPQVADSGQPLKILIRPAYSARPIPASELAKLTVSFTVQWTQGGITQQGFARLDPVTGDFVGTVRVPGGKGVATVSATVQEPGVQGTAVAHVSYQPGGGMSVDLNIPRGIRVSPGGSLTEPATVNNVGLPPTSIEFLLGGLGSLVVASIAPTHPVAIGSGRSTVMVTIRFGMQTRGEVLGTVQYEVTGSGVLNTAAFLDVNVEPPPTTPWWVWALIAIGAAGLAGLLLWWWRRRRKDRINVGNVGFALKRPGGPPTVPYVRWSGGYTQVRWFSVDKTGAAQTLTLTETTSSGAGMLELRRDPADRQLTLAVHATPPTPPTTPTRQETPTARRAAAGPAAAGRPRSAPQGTSVPEATPAPHATLASEPMKPPVGKWFEPPAGADLDGCQLMLVELLPENHDEAPSQPARATDQGRSDGKLRRQPSKPLVLNRRDTNGQQEGT